MPFDRSKASLRAMLRLAPVRAVTSSVMALARIAGRIASALKFAALFPSVSKGWMHWSTEVKYPERIRLGESVTIGPYCVLGGHGGIEMGDLVRLSRAVTIETATLNFRGLSPPYAHESRRIVIGRGVWIGANAMVLGGVVIGEFSVVAAGAVVTRSVPPYSIVSGVPATVTGTRAPGDREDGLDHATGQA